MIKSHSMLQIDNQGKEIIDEGFQLLDLTANDGDIHQFAAGHIPSHWHKELEIFILLNGSVQADIGSHTCRLQAGEGCFINTEVIHSFTADTLLPCPYRSFVFRSDMVGGMPGSIFDTTYVRPLLENGAPFLKFRETQDPVYFAQFARIFTACVEEPWGYEFQVRDALSQILLYVKSKSPDNPRRTLPSIQEARLKEMLVWIHKHLEQKLSVSDIAGAVNICPRECQRIFNQYLHYSPMEYLQRARIFAAAEQLSHTDLPITNIALNCGFSNPSYFSRQFKSLMGSTPKEYRSLSAEICI